jgi:hypothetical protein
VTGRARFAVLAAGMAAIWLAYGLGWAAIALPRHGWRLGSAVLFNLTLVLPLALGAALAVPVARLVHAADLRTRSALALHVLGALAFVAFDAVASRQLGVVTVPLASPWTARTATRDVLAYTLMAAATHAIAYRVSSRREEERAAALAASLARRRMEALRWTLRPDTILAALDRVGELAAVDPERADAEVVRLAATLRQLLAAPDEPAPRGAP